MCRDTSGNDKQATVIFKRAVSANTALLLDGATLGPSKLSISLATNCEVAEDEIRENLQNLQNDQGLVTKIFDAGKNLIRCAIVTEEYDITDRATEVWEESTAKSLLENVFENMDSNGSINNAIAVITGSIETAKRVSSDIFNNILANPLGTADITHTFTEVTKPATKLLGTNN